jgi:hypothetical protein
MPTVPTTKPLLDDRMWSLTDRHAKLSRGLQIKIVDGKDFLIDCIPLPLIGACSIKADMVVKDNTIRLPTELKHYAVKKFIGHSFSFCTEASVARMVSQGLLDVEKLYICSAAEVVGMAMYTQDSSRAWSTLPRISTTSHPPTDISTSSPTSTLTSAGLSSTKLPTLSTTHLSSSRPLSSKTLYISY